MIAVEAALRAEVAGLRMRVDGFGQVLTCRLEGDARDFFSALRRSRQLLATLRLIVPVLVRTGLRVDVVAGNTRVGRVGYGVTPNALGRLLRLPAAHIGV